MNEISWWGYLHSNGTIQVKRWFGDPKDYKDDCEDNPFVIEVFTPFFAASRKEAEEVIGKRLLSPKTPVNDGIRRIDMPIA